MLQSVSNGFQPQRSRATYHQTNSTWLGRKWRRFMLQYPKSPFYAVAIFCVSGMTFPYLRFAYKYATLSKEEFVVYREHHNAVARERQKFGTSLFIPFVNKDKADDPTLT